MNLINFDFYFRVKNKCMDNKYKNLKKLQKSNINATKKAASHNN